MTLPATSEDSIAAAVAAAVAARETLLVEGNGTKSGLMRPVRAARTLSTAGLSGITLYAPKELIISARAGTPMPEIEATLAEAGQHLIAEPPDLSALLGGNGKPQTLGGVVATNLSGPRRIACGAIRDHVMGIRAVNGRAELIRSGGRVLKNVTGLDLCKLFTGSYGTLGVLTEITLKVLPAPEATGTLVLPGLDAAAGIAACPPPSARRSTSRPPPGCRPRRLPRSAALDGVRGPAALIRIEEFANSVTYRIGRLRDQFAVAGAVTLDTEASRVRLARRPRCPAAGAAPGGRRLAGLGQAVRRCEGSRCPAAAWRGGVSRLGWRFGLACRSGGRRHPSAGRSGGPRGRGHMDPDTRAGDAASHGARNPG